MKFPVKATLVPVSLALAAAPPLALAQDQGGEEGAGAGQGPGVTVVQLPQAEPTVETQVVVPGYPQPGFDPNAHLPSSSRGTTDTSRASDGFDLGRRSEGPASVRGGANGSYVVEGQFVPESHSVRRGDTLWDISGRYYTNPYAWPQVWALNPQLQNPHWIYPGDRIRLRDPNEGPTRGNIGASGARRGGRVAPKTIFLRDLGWVDDVKKDTWGELVASPEDQMLLSEGDDVYLRLADDHDVAIGQELTIFREIKKVKSGDARGELVTVRGTARVDRYNPKTHMVRARLIESLDVVERGDRVGSVVRRFDVVPPASADQDLEARIIAAIYPYQLFGQHQVVFIDKGEKDGVKPGQRFFAVRRGDRWVQQLGGAGKLATLRPKVQDERPAQVDTPKFGVDEELLPDETYAELRVVHVRERTAAALVTQSMHEVERDAVLVSRKGF
ncbi:LysM peptidoglycan-binding domain-containing protein [Sorangium sp. So ce1389]|uniref:LysM peptidoglycan-binding domain-containing protein n=1 Tax=Sorangium sp. So ce1389 TaxID=3133336 RepID=UPI003F63B3C8